MSVIDQGCFEITSLVKQSPTASFDVSGPFTKLVVLHVGISGVLRPLPVVLTALNASFRTNQFQVGDCLCWTAYG